jgi:hypothetical protein
MSFLKNIFISLLIIHSSFLHIFFIFSNIFEFGNSKSLILKFSEDQIRQISIKFTKFIKPE